MGFSLSSHDFYYNMVRDMGTAKFKINKRCSIVSIIVITNKYDFERGTSTR